LNAKLRIFIFTIMKYNYLLLIFVVNAVSLQAQNLKWVDPFIGTAAHGHTYPGATLPFGLVQLSPDTDDTGWDWCSGYNYQDSTIMGFSHTHLSGTGISDMADVLIMPMVGKAPLQPGDKSVKTRGYRSTFSHKNETANPGYYKVVLDKFNITAELTAGENYGVHRYTFPATDSATILIDLLHGLDRHRSWLTERVNASEISIVNQQTITGYRHSTGWANDQKLYFNIYFSQPFVYHGLAIDDNIRDEVKIARGRNVKGVFQFDTRNHKPIEVTVYIGDQMMPISRERITFDEVHQRAQKIWDDELKPIKIIGSEEIKKNFFTAWYHTMMAPNVISKVENNYNITTLSQWDTYRAAFPLHTLVRPEFAKQILRSMFYDYEKQGYLPVWKLWNDDVHCMIGSPSVPIFCEGYKKIKNLGISKEEFEEAIIRSVTTDNPVAPWTMYNRYGFIPYNIGEYFSVSKTLEMAYAHGCIADVLSHHSIHPELINDHRSKSTFYKNTFDPKSGFFRGKSLDGTFNPSFDPTKTDETSFVEATPWQYLFHVQHDIDGLKLLLGGSKGLEKKLDEFFSAGSATIDAHILDITGTIGQYAHGNEPSHHVAYLYNYTDSPWKTQKRIAQICREMYKASPDGLCGNEDCGQMSAWYVFSSLGFYPVHPTSGMYQLGCPTVEYARIPVGDGNSLEIKTRHYSPGRDYVREVYWNGKRLLKPELFHEEITKGGILEFVMSDVPVSNCYR
jgi:predicted alpha-1,2-mannosidase